MNAFHEVIDTYRGWAKYNSHYWRRDYDDFVRFFARKCLNEPHSTKQIEDFIGWALETDADTLIDTVDGLRLSREEPWADRLPRVHCPTLTLHGDVDVVRPYAQGEALARATGGALVTMKGSGHLPEGRDPVRVNRLLFDFLSAGSNPPPAKFRRAPARAARRALYISSPIGLGMRAATWRSRVSCVGSVRT